VYQSTPTSRSDTGTPAKRSVIALISRAVNSNTERNSILTGSRRSCGPSTKCSEADELPAAVEEVDQARRSVGAFEDAPAGT
jgi:hypothetical protein